MAEPFGGKRNKGSKKGRRPVPDYLKDLRAVYKQPKDKDRPGVQENLRGILEKEPKEFFKMLQGAESEHRRSFRYGGAAEEEKGKDEVEEKDEGTERVLELLEAEWAKVKELVP